MSQASLTSFDESVAAKKREVNRIAQRKFRDKRRVALAERSTHLEKISRLEQYITRLEQQLTRLISERPIHLEKICILEREISQLREHPVLFSSSHGITTVSPTMTVGTYPSGQGHLTPAGSAPQMDIYHRTSRNDVLPPIGRIN